MGDTTENKIFYKPDHNTSGTGEKASFDAGLTLADKMILQSAAPGVLVNGKLAVSFNSGTLYVGIKTADEGTPSPTNPVFCRVGARVVTITSALEMNKASSGLGAGSSWLHLAQPATSGYETDLFAYIGYDETNQEPMLLVSRSGWHDRHAFNSETSGRGALTSQASLATFTGEDIAVCGRFNTVLTTPNNWSSPASPLVVQKPITQTRMLNWNPMFVVPYGGSLSPGTYNLAIYQMEGKFFNSYVFGYFNYSAAPTTLADYLELTLPHSSQSPNFSIWQALGRYRDYGTGAYGIVIGMCSDTNTWRIHKSDLASFSLGTIYLSFYVRHFIPGTIFKFDI